MIGGERHTVVDPRPRGFDVICAGEAVLNMAQRDGLIFRPEGGAINAALALARQGLRIGLASVLSDDTSGRAILAKVAASGVDIGGVELARPSSGLVFV